MHGLMRKELVNVICWTVSSLLCSLVMRGSWTTAGAAGKLVEHDAQCSELDPWAFRLVLTLRARRCQLHSSVLKVGIAPAPTVVLTLQVLGPTISFLPGEHSWYSEHARQPSFRLLVFFPGGAADVQGESTVEAEGQDFVIGRNRQVNDGGSAQERAEFSVMSSP